MGRLRVALDHERALVLARRHIRCVADAPAPHRAVEQVRRVVANASPDAAPVHLTSRVPVDAHVGRVLVPRGQALDCDRTRVLVIRALSLGLAFALGSHVLAQRAATSGEADPAVARGRVVDLGEKFRRSSSTLCAAMPANPSGINCQVNAAATTCTRLLCGEALCSVHSRGLLSAGRTRVKMMRCAVRRPSVGLKNIEKLETLNQKRTTQS